FKEEPKNYSFDQLVHDGKTTWNGISNALALKHLRQVSKGDEIFFYHTGKEKAIVGIMVAASDAVQDGEVCVVVKPRKKLSSPVPLAIVKKDPTLQNWELARISRLSIIPVTAAQWRRVLELAQAGS
ncbi:MAG TPA: EVE domain-containing protein, partial [Gemmatales bacterium]|nr:EVE domain-containing protein [Gemmatales bacterium]